MLIMKSNAHRHIMHFTIFSWFPLKHVIEETCTSDRTEDTHGDAEDGTQNQRDSGQIHADGQGSQNNAGDVFIVSERLPEVTMKNIVEPMSILHRQWPIQPQFLPKSINLFFCSIRAKHRQDRVSRDKMYKKKGNERNEDNDNRSG